MLYHVSEIHRLCACVFSLKGISEFHIQDDASGPVTSVIVCRSIKRNKFSMTLSTRDGKAVIVLN